MMNLALQDDSVTLATRVARLERQAIYLRRVASSLGLMLCLLAAWSLAPNGAHGSGPGPAPGAAREAVSGSAFHLLDSEGKLRATLALVDRLEGTAGQKGQQGRVPSLTLLDPDGRVRADLTLTLAGEPSLTFPATERHPGLLVRTDGRAGSLELTFSTYEGLALAVLRADRVGGSLTLRTSSGAILFSSEQGAPSDVR